MGFRVWGVLGDAASQELIAKAKELLADYKPRPRKDRTSLQTIPTSLNQFRRFRV